MKRAKKVINKKTTKPMNKYGFLHPISSAGTVTLHKESGVICDVVLNAPSNGTISLYDGVDATGTPFAVIAAQTPAQSLHYGGKLNTGLTVVTTGNSSVTITSADWDRDND